MALQWADLDLEKANLQVRHTVQRTPQGYVIDEAKTDYSRRSIALSATVVQALRRHRQAQIEERLLLGPAWQDLDLVFCNEGGGRLSKHFFQGYRWFGRTLRAAQLPLVRFHDLRHTAATLLLARGVNPKVVSEMLGHSSVAITLGLYGHVTPHMQRHAAQTMDEVFGPEMA
jgi:integrase